MITKKPKVYVAMSGGVDSSVAAALLKKQGFEVVGVFFKPWSAPETSFCNWEEDRRDAIKVATKLGIEFKTWDFSKEYERGVVKYMVDSYRNGITPNPDVMCNKEIKFGLFLKKALAEGADYIATGHYARRSEILNNKSKIKIYKLLKAIDSNKDQTYFLWTLTQEQLKYSLFPIGNYTKPEVRKLAKKFGLPNFDKKDSQGVCFVGRLNIKSFLKKYIKPRIGKVILLETGEFIGQHDGIFYYTIGQRHGLDIKNGKGPYYVAGKNLKKNILYVTGPDANNKLAAHGVNIRNTNWISYKPKPADEVAVKIRYRTEALPAIITPSGNDTTVKLKKNAKAVTAGQSAVFYYGKIVLGGGIIK